LRGRSVAAVVVAFMMVGLAPGSPVLSDQAGITEASAEERIAFASARSGTLQIYTMLPDGSGVKHVSPNQSSSVLDVPAWSPDGTRLLHTAVNGSQTEIIERASDGTGSFSLVETGPTNETDPVYVPGDAQNGRAWVSSSDGDPEIFIRAGGNAPAQLTTNATADGSPSISAPLANGTLRMVYHSNEDGDYDIYMLTLSASGTPSGAPQNLTQEAATATDSTEMRPDISRSGDLVTYSSTAHGDHDIFVLNIGSGAATHMTMDAADETDPTFSPTAGSIAFVKDLGGGNTEIFTMPNQASAAGTNITNSPGADQSPDWGPAAGTPPEGGRDVPTNLTAKKNRKFIRGKAITEEECIPGREVTLFRRKKGTDPIVGINTTNTLGRWAVKTGRRQGTYYATIKAGQATDSVTGEALNCLPDQSKDVRRT
jgi:WD40-like Beta Propeller Repeat